MHIGEIIRKIRKERKMTLVELSEKSSVALATLSRIENSKMTGTLDSHMRMCDALGISLPELYKQLPSQKKTAEVKLKESSKGTSVHDKRSSSEMLASNVQGKKMLPLMIRISKGGRTGTEELKLGAEKFIYVLDGKIEINIGEEKYALSKDDTIYFTASAPHYFKNSGASEARLIAVSC